MKTIKKSKPNGQKRKAKIKDLKSGKNGKIKGLWSEKNDKKSKVNSQRITAKIKGSRSEKKAKNKRSAVS